MDWYSFALISLVTYALQGLLLKYAADKKYDKGLITLFYLLTVSGISLPLFLIYGTWDVTVIGLAAAIINGIFYSIQTSTRIETLKYIAASVAYPVIRLNNAVVALLMILLLGEKITFQILIGIILAVISLYFLSQGEKNEKRI